MAGHGTSSFLRASDLSAPIDGVITSVVAAAADDPRRRRAEANGDRDDDVACGWSSAVVERGLALRRRGGSCSRRRDGLIRAAGDEWACRSEKAAAPGALGIGAEEAAVAKAPAVDMVSFFCLAVL
ncbi:unnamed protein product [Urochloa decumbens]|uniref:Uncharacterized protein n=1 Tax=Urochloa decumbens TaxID=240449 RepID=A0ABC8WY08_9POAL